MSLEEYLINDIYNSGLVSEECNSTELIKKNFLFYYFFIERLSCIDNFIVVKSREEHESLLKELGIQDYLQYDYTLTPIDSIKPMDEDQINHIAPYVEEYWPTISAYLEYLIDEELDLYIKYFQNKGLSESECQEVLETMKSSLCESYKKSKDVIIEGLIRQLDFFFLHIIGWSLDATEEYLLTESLDNDSRKLINISQDLRGNLSIIIKETLLNQLEMRLKGGLLEWAEDYLNEIPFLIIKEHEWYPLSDEALQTLIKKKEIPTADLKKERIDEILVIPSNSLLLAVTKSLYNHEKWEREDSDKIIFRHKSHSGKEQVIVSLEENDRNRLKEFSAETVDIMLILLSKITALSSPEKIAHISLSEIVVLRDVHKRDGSKKKLLQEYQQEIIRLSEIILKVIIGYREGNIIRFGHEELDRLFIIDEAIVSKKDDNIWKEIKFHGGEALTYYLSNKNRQVGNYSQKILSLNPYKDSFMKKVGTYWLLSGVIAYKYGQNPTAKISTILEFCGESVEKSNPGRTVDRFINSHLSLEELGILKIITPLEPAERYRSYITDWLNKSIEVELSKDIGVKMDRKEKVPDSKKKKKKETSLSSKITPNLLQENPRMIRIIRRKLWLHQNVVAEYLGISQAMLSRYENGKNKMSEETADNLSTFFNKKLS